MRLSQEKSRRLSALVWRDRLRQIVPVLLAVAVLFAGASYMLMRKTTTATYDQTVEIMPHTGTVTSVSHTGPRSSIAHVHLDDGRDVDAFSSMTVIPPAGAHVRVNEARHASGRLTFDVKGLE